MNGKIPKNFLLFTLEFPPARGGVSRYYENLAKYWPAGELAVLADGQPLPDDPPNISRRPFLNKWLRPRWLPALFYLKKSISSRKPHVIVGQILPLGIAAYFLAKIFKFEYSVILHGLDFSLATKRLRLAKKILQGAKKIICGNGYTASRVRTLFAGLTGKIAVVNPAIEPFFIRQPQRARELKKKHNLEGRLVVFGLGRLVKRKGFDKAIEAWPEIISGAPNSVLVLAGAGPEEAELKKMAEALPPPIRGKIIFLGGISEEDRWAWLELCDIFIMTPRDINGDYEGFGTVYLEAGLAGKPVIAGDSGGVRDAVHDGVNGLLVNPEDAAAIAAAVVKLAHSELLRKELGEGGSRRVVETMNAKKQAEKIFKELN